ncbi:MAG: hypothetical protein K2R98_09490 [Gemmataceae bacterium]|nr:hypothetical protein [Gemmataceae bacterium]
MTPSPTPTAEQPAKRLARRRLTIQEILRWCDDYRRATGKWPTKDTGGIADAKFETWANVDNALRVGLRGLPGGSSLARLLAEQRGVRNIHALAPLTVEQILAWADAFHARTGQWPKKKSGVILDTGGEKWDFVDSALQNGGRGLPGGSSLPRLLAEHRGIRNRKQLPSYTEQQILAWADAHHARTGEWPTSGSITDAPGETWTAVQVALRQGRRGLPGGSSLALLLAEHRGVRNVWTRPLLNVEQTLEWADAFHARTGEWPHIESGAIPESPGDTWLAVNHSLRRGTRGLPGGSSLAKLLSAERGVRYNVTAPPLTRKQILAWADAHFKKTGKWPTMDSGTILDAPDETWAAVDGAMKQGSRGLRGGSSLAWLLVKFRGKKSRLDQPPLSQKRILAWCDAHFERTGKWPNTNSGDVVDAAGEKWKRLDSDLREGQRGLPGGSSLAKLLARKRGLRNPAELPLLTEAEILRLADLHFQRTSKYPYYNDGPVADAPGETWAAFDLALRYGRRSLPGGSSLAKLLSAAGRKKHRNRGF